LDFTRRSIKPAIPAGNLTAMFSRFLLAAHVVLLILASTSYSLVVGSDGRFQWEYFRYLSQSGWGQPYQFPYTLPVVLTYLAAYSTGVASYVLTWRRGSTIVGGAGILLCALGFASFAYELSHWFRENYNAWIFSAPAALLVLAAADAIQWYRSRSVGFTRDAKKAS